MANSQTIIACFINHHPLLLLFLLHYYNLAWRLWILSCPFQELNALMLPTSQDYWSELSDIWFQKQIQNNTPLPCHSWAGCITEWRLCCRGETVRLEGISAHMQTPHPFRLTTVEHHSLVSLYPSWHWLCGESQYTVSRASPSFPSLSVSAFPAPALSQHYPLFSLPAFLVLADLMFHPPQSNSHQRISRIRVQQPIQSLGSLFWHREQGD